MAPQEIGAAERAQILAAFGTLLSGAQGSLFGGTDTAALHESAAAGIAAIRGHDPGFDEVQFLNEAESAYRLVFQGVREQRPELSRQIMADELWRQQRDALTTLRAGRQQFAVGDPQIQ